MLSEALTDIRDIDLEHHRASWGLYNRLGWINPSNAGHHFVCWYFVIPSSEGSKYKETSTKSSVCLHQMMLGHQQTNNCLKDESKACVLRLSTIPYYFCKPNYIITNGQPVLKKSWGTLLVHTLGLSLNGCHFAENIFKCISWNEISQELLIKCLDITH